MDEGLTMALNILVVDDSSVMRAMISRVLRVCGLPLGEVHEAGNGEDGLRVVDQKWIDLALIDINMPVMNGEEMIDRLRMNPETADLPVVVISTESSETRIERLKRKGVRFIHKPFTPEMLKDTIAEVTGAADEEQSGDGFIQYGGLDF